MPTTLGTISNTAIKVRWREPYASESLNRKFTGVVPSGVYRGLILGTSVTALSVDISADGTTGDHVAFFESETGFTTTYTDDTSGTVTLSLSSYATNDVVVITVFVNYTVGASTTAEFRGYTLAEYEALTAAARRALVVLGTVLRPASGTIPAANITHDRRTLPFLNRSDQMVPWNPLLRNGGFELGEANGTYRHSSPFWRTAVSNANFSVRPVTTEARTGFKSLELTTSVAGVVTATIQQDLWLPVVAGRYVMGTLYKKALQAATTSPSGTFRFVFGDQNGTNDVNEDLVFDVDAIDASFVELTGIIQVPTGATVLKYVQIIVIGTYASAAPCIRFDDVKAWAQVTSGDWLDVRDSRSSETAVGDLFIGAANSYANNSAKVSFDGTFLGIERRDEVKAATSQPPAISVRARGFNETGNSRYTLLWQTEIPSVSGSIFYRKYASALGFALVETINASWNHGSLQWSKDLAGIPATRYDVSYNGPIVKGRVADAAWSDSGWVDQLTSQPSNATTLSNPQFAPILAARDPGGNRKVIVDHNGFVMGRQIVLNELWWQTNAGVNGGNVPVGWSQLHSGGGSWTIGDYGIARLDVGPAGGEYNRLKTFNTSFIPTNDSNLIVTAEWEFSPNNVNIILPECGAVMGFFNNGPGNGGSGEGVWIGVRNTDTTWQFASQFFGGAGVYWTDANGAFGNIVDTGVSVTSLATRMRIEIYGSHSSFGGARALAYINGNIVGEIASADLPLSYLGWGMEITRTLAGGTRSISVGPVKVVHNRRVRSDDAL